MTKLVVVKSSKRRTTVGRRIIGKEVISKTKTAPGKPIAKNNRQKSGKVSIQKLSLKKKLTAKPSTKLTAKLIAPKLTAITYEGNPSTVIPRTPFAQLNASRPAFFPKLAASSQVVSENLRVYLRIYRKTVSNLKNREKILRSIPSAYEIGPTIIWTETPDDLAIFTTDESYTNFIGFEAPFNNPRSPKYLKKILSSKLMRMKKGSILIKEATIENTKRVPVHFCAYRIDENGMLSIFDPSWHSADPGIYSTTAFYDSLDAFGISITYEGKPSPVIPRTPTLLRRYGVLTYVHAESKRTHHWQSLIPYDDYCQTWTLKWLMNDTIRTFPLPKTQTEARSHVSAYMREFTQLVLGDMSGFMANLPSYKLEGNEPLTVFHQICAIPQTIL